MQFVTTNNANLPWDLSPKNSLSIHPEENTKMFFYHEKQHKKKQ